MTAGEIKLFPQSLKQGEVRREKRKNLKPSTALRSIANVLNLPMPEVRALSYCKT
ncbi:MAG: hypothetical protein AB1485_00155 [Candidatus Thermoplasmatota archaeon]